MLAEPGWEGEFCLRLGRKLIPKYTPLIKEEVRGTEGGGVKGDAMMEKLETQEEQKQDDNHANPAPFTDSRLRSPFHCRLRPEEVMRPNQNLL